MPAPLLIQVNTGAGSNFSPQNSVVDLNGQVTFKSSDQGPITFYVFDIKANLVSPFTPSPTSLGTYSAPVSGFTFAAAFQGTYTLSLRNPLSSGDIGVATGSSGTIRVGGSGGEGPDHEKRGH